MPIGTGITDELEFEEVFNIIENFGLVTSQFSTTIHTKLNTKDGYVFLNYANKENEVDDLKEDDMNRHNYGHKTIRNRTHTILPILEKILHYRPIHKKNISTSKYFKFPKIVWYHGDEKLHVELKENIFEQILLHHQ